MISLTPQSPPDNEARLRELLINDNGFAFDPRTGTAYNLSESSLQIIQWIKAGFSQNEIVDQLVQRYDVAPQRARQDCEQFMRELCRHQLIASEEETS